MSYCAAERYWPRCMDQCRACKGFEAQDRQRAQKALYESTTQGVQLRLFNPDKL